MRKKKVEIECPKCKAISGFEGGYCHNKIEENGEIRLCGYTLPRKPAKPFKRTGRPKGSLNKTHVPSHKERMKTDANYARKITEYRKEYYFKNRETLLAKAVLRYNNKKYGVQNVAKVQL